MPAAVEPRLRVWYNSELKSKNYIVPGLIAVILMIISAMLTSLTIAREWEMGTMEQLLSTPLRPAELVLGKMSAYFTLGLADALIAVGIGVLLFGVPLRGNLALLFASTCIFLFGALCWGILISAIARSQLLACQMGILSSFLPAFLLSGFIFSIENMPGNCPGHHTCFSCSLFRDVAESHLPERRQCELALGRACFSASLLYRSLRRRHTKSRQQTGVSLAAPGT